MTKKDRFINWLKMKKVFATNEIQAVGLRLYYTRADRTKRDLMEDGLIRKLDKSEHEHYGYKADTRQAVYIWKESVPEGCMI